MELCIRRKEMVNNECDNSFNSRESYQQVAIINPIDDSKLLNSSLDEGKLWL